MRLQPPAREGIFLLILAAAAGIEGGKASKASSDTSGMDVAAILSAACGPAGVALAMAWSVFSLGRAIGEYVQLRDLFRASLDPTLLIRGDADAEPGRLGLFLDLLGLLVWPGSA